MVISKLVQVSQSRGEKAILNVGLIPLSVFMANELIKRLLRLLRRFETYQ